MYCCYYWGGGWWISSEGDWTWVPTYVQVIYHIHSILHIQTKWWVAQILNIKKSRDIVSATMCHNLDPNIDLSRCKFLCLMKKQVHIHLCHTSNIVFIIIEQGAVYVVYVHKVNTRNFHNVIFHICRYIMQMYQQ